MPRNSSGTMTLPSPGVPFQSGQVISSAQVNATLTDVATEISDSASRSGKGGFTAPVRVPDGTAAAPAVAFTTEINSGVYRAGTNDVRLAVGGVDSLLFVSGGIANGITMVSGQTQVKVTSPGGWLLLAGNQVAGAPLANPADVVTNSTATRTAGALFEVQNNGTRKVLVDWQGLLQLANTAAIQPASIWTAITPNAGWTASGGLAYWKDANGVVRIKGSVTAGAGSPFTLPSGFRPLVAKIFVVEDNGTGFVSIAINSGGDITFRSGGPTAGHFYAFDPVNFLAEQ